MNANYRIHIRGHLDPGWVDELGGLALVHQQDGTTVLHGAVVDQAALHAILNRICDLGLTLLEVRQEN